MLNIYAAKHNLSLNRSIRPYSSIRFLAVLLLLMTGFIGCAHYPVNVPLVKADPDYGYRGKNLRDPDKKGALFVSMSFSGGGTRAAAFSYGVLEALRDTEITLDGRKTRLLDHVNAIAGVSGGSFTAAYYGLFGDRIFSDFEEKFLKKNIQGELALRVLANPINWARLFSAYFDRSDLIAEYYDKNVFDGATFGDMLKRKGPMVFINATDMVHGTRIAFTQDSFDMICSDLTVFPVARACAASSAVPIVFSPITLRNYAGSCQYEMPEVLRKAVEARSLPNRQFDLANNILPFLDAEKKPYLHLVDGGVSDNLGIRTMIERIIMLGDAWNTVKASNLADIQKVVLIVVNAETQIDTKWDRQESIPPFAAMLDSYSSVSISRYNVETVALLKESLPRWAEEIRRGRCEGREVSSEPGGCGDIQFYVIEVKFDAIKDAEERSFFKLLPTSFKLTADEVDKLREAARRLLMESKDFKRLLGDLK
ncbi:MAG TPA: patatin-like phospholipase family protein [Syntrophorhabdaceae bacterium]|nr:patatin-like phospholipase family protein [Syntrophorhabdaceae bacterium]